LYNTINLSFLQRVASYYSYHKANQQPHIKVKEYMEKDCVFIKQFPPLGDALRDMYNEAAESNTRWGVTEHD